MKRQTPIEKFYENPKTGEVVGTFDALALFDALTRTKFRKSAMWRFKVIYDDGDSVETSAFTVFDEFLSFLFDKCSVGLQNVVGMHYDRGYSFVSVFLAKGGWR